ncbi:hypothetical protein [Faecalibacterium prausnitzii]|uniref:Uncharacterized protein n=1 Tax=Faecalibacterium prausnitzii TaxID=853 RepID=A0AAX1QHV0_9FIRM|nr:hypothetical protein [Faecalibacterium prausnitzii]AXA81058.1 hypothetical protein C3706_01655 [Faecalibacterium prausnitzii]RAW48485.1 hypothetical protein C4N27_11550 [Faecalibacterium prausnitzii]
MRLKSALRRGVAAAVIAGIVVSSGIPAYAKTWDIADGDITVKGASDESGNYNNVKQGEKDFEKDEGETVITGESDKNTVTIDTSEGNVDVTFDDLKIDVSGKKEGDGSGKTEVDGNGKTEVDGSGKTEGNVSDETEGDVSGDSPVDAGKAAVTVQGDHDAAIELDGANELKSGSCNAGLEKNGNESSGKLTIKDDNDTKGSLTAEGGKDGAGIGGGYESGAGNIEITGGTVEAVGGEGAAGIGGGVYGPGRDIEISGGKVSATGGSYSGDPRPGAAGIGDGAGAWSEIDPDAPPSNPNHIIISGDAEVEAKAGASTGGKTAAIGGGIVGEIPNDALSDDDHKVTGGSLTRYDPDGKKMEDYSYDRRTPSQPEQPEQPDKPEQPDDTENDEDDDEDDAPSVQVGEVPDRVKQMYEAMGVITHPDGTQELADVTTAEYDPVNKVLRFDAHGSLFWMTGDSLRELAKEVDELRVRFLDGEGQEMEAVIPLARIKDLVGAKGAFEFGLYHEGIYRFHVVGQTGYDREMFSREREKFLYENVLRENGKELILVYHVGDEEEKAQETARVEEAIARRRQEKEQWWGVVISGLEGGSLSGQPGLTQPGTGAVGDLSGLTTLSPDSLTTAQQPKQPASDQTVWKTFTGNIVKLAGGKQDSKKDDPAPSVGDLSGLPTLSPDSLTTAPQPEISVQRPETSTQQPETGGWVTDSQGDWMWKPGKDGGPPPDLRGDWETRKWIRVSQPPDWEGDWKTRKWVRVSQSPDLAWWNSFYDSIRKYDYEG